MRAVAVGAGLGLLFGAALSVRAAPAVSQASIEEALACQCGCGLTVRNCNHLECGSAVPLRREIAEQIATGKTGEEILAYFEAKYGEKILSAPVARGFNLTAWLVPFGLLLLGAGGIIAWLRRRTVAFSPPPGPAAGEETARYRRILEEDLGRLER